MVSVYEAKRFVRPFSLASSPHIRPQFELYLVKIPGGRFSEALTHLTVGSVLSVSEGCFGHFTLRTVLSCQVLWLFATGSGLSPYLSMLENGVTLAKRIILVHSVRYYRDRVYQDRANI